MLTWKVLLCHLTTYIRGVESQRDRQIFNLYTASTLPYLRNGATQCYCATETIPGQVMLKCSQSSPIMPLHHIYTDTSCFLYFLHITISQIFNLHNVYLQVKYILYQQQF